MGSDNNVPVLGLLVNPHNGGIINFIFLLFAMSEDDNKVVTLKVRVSPEFREQLVTTAKENSRSMNAEIVHRLEKSFEHQSLENVETIALIGELITRFPKETFSINLPDELRDQLLSKNSSEK
nr:Arc family DNA-binding protein [Acinetobacter baumannii]